MRVFSDKLINIEDRDLVYQYINKLVEENFKDISETVMLDPILFGDFMNSRPDDPEVVDPKIYQDCGNFDAVSSKFDGFLNMYNVSGGGMGGF